MDSESNYDRFTFSDVARVFRLYLPENKAEALEQEIARFLGGKLIFIPVSPTVSIAPGKLSNLQYFMMFCLFKQYLPDDLANELHFEIARNYGGRIFCVPNLDTLVVQERKKRMRELYVSAKNFISDDQIWKPLIVTIIGGLILTALIYLLPIRGK